MGGLADRIAGLTRAGARALAWMAGALVLLIALLVAGDVVARNLLGRTVFHSFEISIYLFAAALGFGMAHTLATAGNIRIDVVYRLFPRPVRRALDLLALASLAGLGLFLAWFAWRLTLVSQARGVTSTTTLAVPLAWPQAVWATGMTVFGLVGVVLTLRLAGLMAAGRWAEAEGMAGIAAEADTGEVPQ